MRRIRRRGFTLIELVCVLGLIGIMSSIAYPSIRSLLKADRLKLSSKLLINDIRYAKMYAVAKGYKATTLVRFLRDDKSGTYIGYRILDTGNVNHEILKERYFYHGVIIDGDNSTFSSGNKVDTLEFFSNGSVEPACTIVLKDLDTGKSKKITLTIGFTRIMELEK